MLFHSDYANQLRTNWLQNAPNLDDNLTNTISVELFNERISFMSREALHKTVAD